MLGFNQPHSGELDDIEGFVRIIPGTYKSDKSINITGFDKVHLKTDCLQFSPVNGIREPILYSFALDQPPSHKIYNQARIRLVKKVIKPLLSHITFYLEDDDHKLVDFKNETICFTCQLIKK